MVLWTGWEEGRLRGYLESRFGALVLERLPVEPGSPTAEHLREALKEGLPLSEEARQVLLRLRFLRAQGVEVPELTEESLLADLSWLLPWAQGVRGVEDLKALPWKEILLSLLGEKRALLEALAPENLPLPSGRKKRLLYREDAPPLLSLRVQEAFGLKETPKVLGGRLPVAVELLSPAGRPVQVTQDLKASGRSTTPGCARSSCAATPSTPGRRSLRQKELRPHPNTGPLHPKGVVVQVEGFLRGKPQGLQGPAEGLELVRVVEGGKSLGRREIGNQVKGLRKGLAPPLKGPRVEAGSPREQGLQNPWALLLEAG